MTQSQLDTNMTSAMGLNNHIWDLSKSKYDEVSDMPLMATTGPVFMILTTYLAFVLKVGPIFMRKREAFQINRILQVYNAFQVVLSVYMVQYYLRGLLRIGLTPRRCYLNDEAFRKEIFFGIWIYFVAKITELLDTVFFIVRKKDNQVTFLHVYHHSIMMIGTWAMLKYWPMHNLLFIGFLNSLVHVFMYTYYGLATLGPKVEKYLKWKKYMTKFQLFQFLSIIIQYVISVKVSECPPNTGVATFLVCNTAFFALLFLNFYRQSYGKKKPNVSSGSAKNTDIKYNDNVKSH